MSNSANINAPTASTGNVSNSTQTAFRVYYAGDQNSVTGDGTVFTLPFDTNTAPGFDQHGDYNTTTHLFTAPNTGKYLFSTYITLKTLGAAHTSYTQTFLVNGATSFTPLSINPFAINNNNSAEINCNMLLALNSGDTLQIQITVSGGTKSVGVWGGTVNNSFEGFFVC